LASASAQPGASGNEVNGFGSGFTAIAKDLQELVHEDADINHNISTEADTAASLNLEKLRIHDRFKEMKAEDERLHSELRRSKRADQHVQQKYQHALAFIKNKYQGEIKAMLPRLEVCGKQRDKVASELNVASAELYMAQERLEGARELTNATKKNWTTLVSQLAHAVDEDEQRITALRANISENENDTRRTLLAISKISEERQHLQQVLSNASDRLSIAKNDATHLLKSISQEQHEGAELTKKSQALSNSTKQLLKRIKDQVHVEDTTKRISEASNNASNVQIQEMQETIAAHKAQIVVTQSRTSQATKHLEDATRLLAKDRDLIAFSQNRTEAEMAHATAQCNHELTQVQLEAGQRAAALQVALDEARQAEDKISEENHKLMKQVEALKQQIAHSLIQFDF